MHSLTVSLLDGESIVDVVAFVSGFPSQGAQNYEAKQSRLN